MTDPNSAEARILALGIEIPIPSTPSGTYIPLRRAGDLLYLSGVPPRRSDNAVIHGCVGLTMTAEEGYDAARRCGLTLLANMRAALGSLDKVEALLKVTGFVVAAANFDAYPRVIDGCTDLLVEVFGDAGLSARTSLGVAGLPRRMPVEVEAIALVKPQMES